MLRENRYEWCRKNQLTVHTGKTEAMIISHKNFTGPLRPIWFGTSIIKYVTQSTSLGITIDNKLSWDKQLTKITASFNTKLKELRRFRYLPTKVKEEIYYKTIVSSITYCISVWGTSSPWILEELDSLHARAARLIYGIKDKMSVSNTFARVKWEPISYIYKGRVLTWMQKMYYESCPQPLCGIIKKKSGRLRNPMQLEVPRYKREIGRTLSGIEDQSYGSHEYKS